MLKNSKSDNQTTKDKKLAIALNMLAPYWLELYNMINENGYEVKLFLGEKLEPDRSFVIDWNSIKFKWKKTKNILINLDKFQNKTAFLHFPFGLFFDLVKFKPDIIVSNELGLRTLACLLYAKLFRIPIIIWVCVTQHSERLVSRIRTKWRQFLLNHCDAIFTNMTEAERYLKDLGIKKKIFYTP